MPGVAPLLPNEPASPTAFTIKITWDTSVSTAPAGFTTDILAAVRYIETQFSDPITITIDVGYNEIAGTALNSGDLGESEAYLQPVTYTALRNALISDTKTSTDASVVQSLPGSSPVNGANYWVTTAQAKALGLPALVDPPPVDGYVGFASASNFTYGDTAAGGAVLPGTYDFFATAVHEFTEDMGRQLLTGQNFHGTPQSYTLLDLLHYSGPGLRDFSASTPGYFSVNGGDTNLGEFNTIASGDSGDWALSEPDNPFDAFATSGAAEPVTNDDLAEMDALGWNPSGAGFTTSPVTLSGSSGGASGTPDVTPVVTPGLNPLVPVNDPISQIAVPTPPSISVSLTPETLYPAFTQSLTGLLTESPLAMVGETGGDAGDAFNYALSGPGAASFTLTSTKGGAVLAVGQQPVTGTSGGKLYAMTVTATDETAAAHPSATTTVNVVVGDAGNDSIVLASVPGIVTSAPTFIYGLGGHEIINGGSMTGPLYFNPGTGNDVMGGGAGMNEYEFSIGPEDGAGSVWDIVSNFRSAVDRLDLTWIGCRFSGATALAASATTIAAGSVGWQNSGGNTFVYANTSGLTESLTGTDMKIELQGNIALTNANFVHS